jgi:multiple sugar transport system substrate-binding protein
MIERERIEVGGPPADGNRITRRRLAQGAVAAGLGLGALGAGTATAAPRRVRRGKAITLEYWKFDDTTADKTIKAAVKQWNAANPDVQVKLSTFPFDDYTNGTKLTTAFASGKGPDMFWVSASTMLDFVTNGIAADIGDVLGSSKSKFSKAAIDAVTVAGKIKAVPFEQSPMGIYYRTDIFEKAGIDVPANWDDLRSAAKELTTKKRAGIIIEPSPGAYGDFAWWSFLWSAGGEVVDKNWKKSLLRTPEAASAFQLWGDLVRDGSSPKKLAEASNIISHIGRGNAAMQVCGFWAVQNMKDEYAKVPYSVFPVPGHNGHKPVSVYGGWMQMLNGKSDNLDAAKAFTRWQWITQTKFPRTWACVANTQFSTRADVRASCASVFDTPQHKVFQNKLLPIARAEPRYSSQMLKAVSDGLQASMFSGKSGEQAADLAASGIDRFLTTYKGAH